MRIQITEVKDRVWTLSREYCNTLKSARFGYLHIETPHVAIEQILGKLEPHSLHKRMTNLFKLRKDKSFHKENFDAFVREVASHAQNLQVKHPLSLAHSSH